MLTTTRRRLAMALTTAALITAALISDGCLAPPAVRPGSHINAKVAIGLYPEGTEHVELPTASGERLRGLFVSGGENAPVILHLLEAAGSVATLKLHYGIVCHRLQGLGYSSLIVDYRGVGASDGARSTRHLQEDVQVMWSAALQRAGGDPERVVLRGISLGTVAVAILLEQGAAPGAVILHAPVIGRNAIQRYARHNYGAVVDWISRLLYQGISKADLALELERYDGPVQITSGTNDFFLSDADRERLTASVLASEGRVEMPPTSHFKQAILAHELNAREGSFLQMLAPPVPLNPGELDALLRALDEHPQAGPGIRGRLEAPAVRHRLAILGGMARNADPLLIAAIAIQNDPGPDSLAYLWLLDESNLLRNLHFDQVLDSVSLQDPTGAMGLDLILSVALFQDMSQRYGYGISLENVTSAVKRVDLALKGEGAGFGILVEASWDQARFTFDPMVFVEALRSQSVQEEEIRRVAVRTLLKGARIPERIRRSKDGSVHLQVLQEGAWADLDLDPSHHPEVWSSSIPFELGWRARELLQAE